MARILMERSGELEVFLRVVQEGGFSAAARSVGLTPSAVSKLITRLETRLGARLFAEEVQQARVERETELREQLGLVPHGRPELGAGAAPGPRTRPASRPAPGPDPRRDD